ncbi:hypothetical protein GBAR_LOCUS18313 [Geodia barretti]|uniref:Uncharacterized protein n=1 Tax=Geodia barretti TaxID=519541 RepID=A0AA35WZM6_GEOBA|nr:hypothetical protein GBAR_LOCUS18313 [Geodia barretti]
MASFGAISILRAGFQTCTTILTRREGDDIKNFVSTEKARHTYFSSPLAIVKTTVAMVRSRTLHPPPLAPEFVGLSLLSKSTMRNKRTPSPLLTHNFTTYSWDFWNEPPGPFISYPSTPFKRGPLSGYRFSDPGRVERSERLPHSTCRCRRNNGTQFRRLITREFPRGAVHRGDVDVPEEQGADGGTGETG